MTPPDSVPDARDTLFLNLLIKRSHSRGNQDLLWADVLRVRMGGTSLETVSFHCNYLQGVLLTLGGCVRQVERL